jgi:hypothetical protein
MRIANRAAARVGVATVAAGVLAAGALTLVSSAGASPSSGADGQLPPAALREHLTPASDAGI